MADLSRFHSLMQQRSSGYDHFSLAACIKKGKEAYDIIFGKVIAQRRGTEKAGREELDFGEYAYVKETLRLDELAPILQEQMPTFTIGKYRVVFPNAYLNPHGSGKMGSKNSLTPWPTEVLELRPQSHANYLNPAALVAHGCSRMFHDQYEGIREFVGTNVSFDYNNGLIGAMLLILPDYRIRISAVSAREHTLTVSLEKNKSFVGAELHCLVDGSAGRDEMHTHIQSDEVSVQLKVPVEQLEIIRLFITSAADGIVDWYEQTPTFHSGATRWISGGQQQTEEDVIAEIKRGEGPQRELKPYVKLGKGEKKAGEVLRAAIAFANTSGGTIYFGVNDWLEIEGIEDELKKEYHTGDVTTAAHRYASELQTMVNDKTSEPLELSWTVFTAEGHVLLKLDVAEFRQEKPVWDVHTREAWVRVRSHKMRADPETIKGLIQRGGFAL